MRNKTAPTDTAGNGIKPVVKGCLREECRCMAKHGRIIRSCKWRMKNNLLRRDEWDKAHPTIMQKREIEKTKAMKFRSNNNLHSICKKCGRFRNLGDDRCKCKRGKAGQLLS